MTESMRGALAILTCDTYLRTEEIEQDRNLRLRDLRKILAI